MDRRKGRVERLELSRCRCLDDAYHVSVLSQLRGPSAEKSACFHAGTSKLQQTWIFRGCVSTVCAHTAIFLGSLATLRRSTTVEPRVRSLDVSISTKCSLDEVQSAGFSAIPIVTGSGRQIPRSPVCLKKASAAVLLHRMAKSARGLFDARSSSISSWL